MISGRRLVVRTLQKLGLNRPMHRFYYQHLHGFDTANRSVLAAQGRCFDLALELGLGGSGDYYEFGLFKGYSFLNAQRQAERLHLENMRFFGFDSFKGLPRVSGIDQTTHNEFYEGQYACSKDAVVSNLTAAGADWNRIHLVEGFYDESLTDETRRDLNMGRVAIALIDCDLYSSTREVLEFLESLLVSDSILMFDDWNCFEGSPDRGQRKALAEFTAENPDLSTRELFAYGDYGQVFLIQKEDPVAHLER